MLLARPSPGVDPAVVAKDTATAPEHVGVHGASIEVDVVDEIPRTALGKAPLVRRAPPAARADD